MQDELSTLKQRRKALGLSRKAFAMQCGISAATISKIECNAYRDTTKKTDRKIFMALEYLEKRGVGKNQ